MSSCPCGTKVPFRRCCSPYISGETLAESPERLVRARYTAFTRADMKFLTRTYHPRTVCRFNIEENQRWAEGATWKHLEIVEASDASSKEEATVEFIATYSVNGIERIHHERSIFRHEDGKWFFYDGISLGA